MNKILSIALLLSAPALQSRQLFTRHNEVKPSHCTEEETTYFIPNKCGGLKQIIAVKGKENLGSITYRYTTIVNPENQDHEINKALLNLATLDTLSNGGKNIEYRTSLFHSDDEKDSPVAAISPVKVLRTLNEYGDQFEETFGKNRRILAKKISDIYTPAKYVPGFLQKQYTDEEKEALEKLKEIASQETE